MYVVNVYIYTGRSVSVVPNFRMLIYGSFWVKNAISIFAEVSTVISLLTSCFKMLYDTVRHQTLWTSFTLNPTSKVRRWSSKIRDIWAEARRFCAVATRCVSHSVANSAVLSRSLNDMLQTRVFNILNTSEHNKEPNIVPIIVNNIVTPTYIVCFVTNVTLQ